MTNSSDPGNRILLTYPAVSYTRLLVYASICVLTYFLVRVYGDAIAAAVQRAEKTAVNGYFPWQEALPLTIIAFSGFLTVSEGFFLLNQRLFQNRVEYDEEHIFVTFRGEETAIPMAAVTRLRLLSITMRGTRGSSSRYAIEYAADPPDVVRFTVYNRTARSFTDFQKLLAFKNPSAEIRNSSFGATDLGFRLFRNKK